MGYLKIQFLKGPYGNYGSFLETEDTVRILQQTTPLEHRENNFSVDPSITLSVIIIIIILLNYHTESLRNKFQKINSIETLAGFTNAL